MSSPQEGCPHAELAHVSDVINLWPEMEITQSVSSFLTGYLLVMTSMIKQTVPYPFFVDIEQEWKGQF